MLAAFAIMASVTLGLAATAFTLWVNELTN